MTFWPQHFLYSLLAGYFFGKALTEESGPGWLGLILTLVLLLLTYYQELERRRVLSRGPRPNK